MPTYILGSCSQKELIGVHPDLVHVVKRSIQLTLIDFSEPMLGEAFSGEHYD